MVGIDPSLQWWTLLKQIRTLAEVEFEFICLGDNLFKYQELAPKVAKLARLGMSERAIARQLKTGTRTVRKAREFFEGK